MSPCLPDRRVGSIAQRRVCRRGARLRAGFTLIELLISASILGFSAATIAGVMLAVNSAWNFSAALEDGRRQAQSTLSRIKWMVQQAGVYQNTGQATSLGLAVISTPWGSYQVPDMLVVWSGGSGGGMNALGLQTRLPAASELVIYTSNPSAPAQFIEITFPGNSTSVDFQAATFSTTIQSLMASGTMQSVLLSDRLHVVSGQGGTQPANVGCARFELIYSPSDSQISSVVVGSQAWNSLSWADGLVGATMGLRSANLRVEILLDPNPANPTTNSDGYTTVVPFFGSVNRQYVYQP